METSKYHLLLMCATLVIAVVPGDSSSKMAGTCGLDEEYGGLVTYDFRIFHPSTRDTAFVYICNYLDVQIFIWIQSKECYQCEQILLGPVGKGNAKLDVDTSWVVTMRVTTGDTLLDNTTICKRTAHFRQFGNYTWYINVNASLAIDCSHMILLNDTADAFLPIYIAISVMIGLAVLYICVKQLWSYEVLNRFLNYLGMERVVSSDLGTPSNPASTSESNSIQRPSRDKPNRLKSLDAFRGMSLVVMIFVNYGGGSYWFFKHSPWNGLTVADLVFPWFVFIMGVSITLSFHALVRHDVTRWAIFLKVFKRFLILFGLGIILQGGTDFSEFRVPGVLQRIAVSYFVVASIHVASATHKDEEYRIRYAIYRELRDILDYWYEWIIMLSLLVLHICLTFLLPVPGCPTGYLGPGGPLVPLVGNNSSVENCTGGAANYIDKVILTYSHTYQRGTPQKLYHTTVPHDPEGILGTLTSIFMTFLGLQAGKIFYLFSYPRGRIIRLLAWCIITGVIAGALCDFSKEGGVIPVNKNLWSVSFILATSSMAFILLAAFYYMIDVQHWWTGVPFYFIGMNSIAVYCGHEVLGRYFPFCWTPIHGTHSELLPMNLLGASLWLVIAYYMYSIKFFVKI